MKTTKVRGHFGVESEGQHPIVSGLAELAKSNEFADVKLVCCTDSCSPVPGGVFWTHRALLASVSPFLKSLLSSNDLGEDPVITLQLPGVKPTHLALVLDYLYTGTMFLNASSLAGVLRVIEVLRMKCGVSVSKMVQQNIDNNENEHSQSFSQMSNGKWIEEAKFEGLDQLPIKQEIDSEIPDESLEDDRLDSSANLQSMDFDPDEKAVEVKPVTSLMSKRRASSDYCAVEVIDDYDSDSDEHIEITEDSDDKDQEEENASATLKCVMCEKTFSHEDNLRVHIRSHLGATAQLKSCQPCKRNFRSALEHELHENSHRYSRVECLKKHSQSKIGNQLMLAQKLVWKYLRAFWKKEALARKKLAATKEKAKIIQRRKQRLSKCENGGQTRKSGRASKLTTKAKEAFEAKSRKKDPPAPKSDPFRLKMKVRLTYFPSESSSSGAEKSKNQKKKTVTSQARKKSTPAKSEPQNRKRPLATVELKSASSPSKVAKKNPSKEEALTCPTCDKTFLAKSIFERHLKTYKHGVYFAGGGDLAPSNVPAFLPPSSAAPLPHFNKVLQPTMEVGGREVNKYECHLCSKVFLRVKDLVKHREKTCSAWMTK